jgi:hypothetical protein
MCPAEPFNLPIVAFVATLKRASEFRKRGAGRKLDTCPQEPLISAASRAAASCAARHGPAVDSIGQQAMALATPC